MKMLNYSDQITEIPEWSEAGKIVVMTHQLYRKITFSKEELDHGCGRCRDMWRKYFSGIIVDEAHCAGQDGTDISAALEHSPKPKLLLTGKSNLQFQILTFDCFLGTPMPNGLPQFQNLLLHCDRKMFYNDMDEEARWRL